MERLPALDEDSGQPAALHGFVWFVREKVSKIGESSGSVKTDLVSTGRAATTRLRAEVTCAREFALDRLSSPDSRPF